MNEKKTKKHPLRWALLAAVALSIAVGCVFSRYGGFVVGGGAVASGLIPEGGYWAFVACIGVLAIACAWFNAPLMTLLQRSIPNEKLGRVMGLFSAMNGLAIPAGTALGGVVAEITSTPAFFRIDGAFILLLAVSLALSKNVRKLDSIT